MSVDLDAGKTAEAVLYLKTIIKGLNDLRENSTKEQIQEIQQAYYSLSVLAPTGDEFAAIVEAALPGVAQEDISELVSSGIKSFATKSCQIFNANDAVDVIKSKDDYTFKCIETNKQSKDVLSDFYAYSLPTNEIAYLCYEDDAGKERVFYRMKSETGSERLYSFDRDKDLDICDDIFRVVKKEYHNETLVSDFKVASDQRRAQLELIFELAKRSVGEENKNSSSSSYFSFFATTTESGKPHKNESSSCLVM